MFSERDLEQLTQHEAFIHTLTLLNGKHQPHLRSLGLGAPRTTRTQEGLATFSEIMTGAIDIARLRRVALRVVMVKQALDGADFIEVFRGFLDAGQTEVESYRSAARVFRGGDVRGKVCFTKDGAYLEGRDDDPACSSARCCRRDAASCCRCCSPDGSPPPT